MKFKVTMLLSLMAMLQSVCTYAHRDQDSTQNPDSLKIARIADFGRAWGVINYFHPAVGKGVLSPDSLLISNISTLLDDPTANGFSNAVSSLFSDLNDPLSAVSNRKDIAVDSPHRTGAHFNFFGFKINIYHSVSAYIQKRPYAGFCFDSQINFFQSLLYH
jgi:hypothetical protein